MTTAKQALAAHRAAWAARSKQIKSNDYTQNEGGEGYSSFEVESQKNFAVELPLIQAAFSEEWTAEAFAARSAAWNAGLAKCKSNGQVADMAKSLGYTLTDLRNAKKMLAAVVR
jgi:hypothetical protein